MVMLSVVEEMKLKGKSPDDALAMTAWEIQRAGAMFRIQLPIFHEADLFADALRAQADLLSGLALQLRVVADASNRQRHFQLVNILKGEVASVNIRAKLSRFGPLRKPAASDE